MSKIAQIQKDVILFSILMIFTFCFFSWWKESKEEFSIHRINHVPGLSIPYWTNSKVNGSKLQINWNSLRFETNKKANSSKNSEFSVTFWLFLGGSMSRSQPIFRISDKTKKNSPGIWLTNDNIHIRNDDSSKILKKTPIPRQSLDFYTVVFSVKYYKIYINGVLKTTENWDSTPLTITEPNNAYLEIATAASKNHYAMKDVKLYDDVFTPDTVNDLFQTELTNIGNIETERENVINVMGGLPVKFASDWIYPPTEDTYFTMSTSEKLNWSTTNIQDSATMSISFWINITEIKPLHYWRNIFHVTNNDKNWGEKGARVPGMWIWWGSTNIHFRHDSANQHNDGPWVDEDKMIPLNTPTFLTIVSNSTTITFYVNGEQRGSPYHFSSPLVSADSTAILYMADPWHAFGGYQLKNFKFFNQVFSANEVSELYNIERASNDIDVGKTCLRKVTAKRIDYNGGWGMDLKFKCANETVEIGPHHGSGNEVTSSTPVNINKLSCPGEVGKWNWLGTDTYGDRFQITTSDCIS